MYKKIEVVDIITPIELDKNLKKEFEELSGRLVGKDKKVVIREQVDENLLGGFVLRIGDKQIDDSVAAKLRELKKKLIIT